MDKELEEVLLLQRSFTTEALATARAVFGVSEQSRAISKAFRDVSNVTRDITIDLQQILRGEEGLSNLLKTQEKQKRNIAALDTELLTTGTLLVAIVTVLPVDPYSDVRLFDDTLLAIVLLYVIL